MSVIFPKWMNALPTLVALGVGGGAVAAVGGMWYYATPKFFDVGYQPTQPGGGFNHQIHAGKLGMDCRYCHSNVEKSYEANIPSVSVCYGCHAEGRLTQFTDSPVHAEKTSFIREAYAKDASIPWRRVHKLADYVHNFPHQVHVGAGVSCYSCHGQIAGMPVVHQVQPLSMSWCLDCHADPGAVLVPKDRVTDLIWVEKHLADRAAGSAEASNTGQALLNSLKRTPPTNCGACHY